MQNYNLSVSGGTAGTTYKLGAGYLKQDGVAEGSDFDRITLNSAIDSKINNWLKIGGTLNVSRTTQTTSIADWNIINSATKQKPYVPVYNLDGSYGSPSESDDTNSPINALAIAQLVEKNNRKLNARGNLYVTLYPAKWMNFKTELSSNVGADETHSFTPSYYFTSWQKNDYATRSETMKMSYYWAWRNIVNFFITPHKNQSLSLMFGQEMTETRSNYLKGTRNMGSNELTDLGAGDALTSENDGYTGRSSFLSFFGRANYSVKNRYFLTATMRADGSSNFARGNRWGYFPSMAFAWRINKESFLQQVEWLNNLKLRVGYGIVGNSNVAQYAYTSILYNTETIWGTGQALQRIPNKDLKWETTKSLNLGFDFAALNNRIEFLFDFYNKRTDDLLIVLSLPGITGTNGTGAMSAPWGNVGSLQNRGFEFTLNTVNMSNRNFSWSSSLIFSLNRNKVLELNTATAQIFKTYQYGGADKNVTITQPGYAIGQFYGYKVIGRINSAADLYDENGNIKVALPENGSTGKAIPVNEKNGVWVGDLLFEDVNGDGIINASDQQVIGNPLPKFAGGFGNTFSWKGFDLNLYFTYSVGNKIMNWLNMNINDPRNYSDNVLRSAGVYYAKYDLIDPEGSADNIYNVHVVSGKENMPRMTSNDLNQNNRVSTNIIEDGSYLRLQSVNFSYTFPKKFIRKANLSQLRVYCNISNLFTITGYSGYDPEVGMARDQYSNYAQSALLNGFDVGRYPSPRTFTFGVNVGF
jgi:TonB-linked SusC/RagA family outer membrane protein